MRLICVLLIGGLLAIAGGQGVAPRASASDYDAHQGAGEAMLAASVLPPKQIEKLFSSRIAKDFFVIEVAVYPGNGRNFDVDWFDFGLKSGDTVAHVERPRDVAMAWPERAGGVGGKPVTVITDTGVAYGRVSDSTGHHSEVGTYENVGVTTDPRAAAPPKQGPDPQVVEARVRDKMIPEGQTSAPVAGYLFFPQLKKRHKGDMAELQWSKNRESAALRLPML
jgi:hypothetical protein